MKATRIDSVILLVPILSSCTQYVRSIGRTQETFYNYPDAIWVSPEGDLALDAVAHYKRSNGLPWGDKEWKRRRFILVDGNLVREALTSKTIGMLAFRTDGEFRAATVRDGFLVEEAEDGLTRLYLSEWRNPDMAIIPEEFYAPDAEVNMLPLQFTEKGERHASTDEPARLPHPSKGMDRDVEIRFATVKLRGDPDIWEYFITTRSERSWWGQAAQVFLLPAVAADVAGGALFAVYVVIPAMVVGVVAVVVFYPPYALYKHWIKNPDTAVQTESDEISCLSHFGPPELCSFSKNS